MRYLARKTSTATSYGLTLLLNTHLVLLFLNSLCNFKTALSFREEKMLCVPFNVPCLNVIFQELIIWVEVISNIFGLAMLPMRQCALSSIAQWFRPEMLQWLPQGSWGSPQMAVISILTLSFVAAKQNPFFFSFLLHFLSRHVSTMQICLPFRGNNFRFPAHWYCFTVV